MPRKKRNLRESAGADLDICPNPGGGGGYGPPPPPFTCCAVSWFTVMANCWLAALWLPGPPGMNTRYTNVPGENSRRVIEYVDPACTTPAATLWKPLPLAFCRWR